ncbi:hypothetical protein Hdeb2414_s0021g00576851 [Helianthus debilis subsp. tardiflorus]
MHIERTVTRFRVFHQMHCTQGFYSFVQRASSKKILLQPPKSFHDWKQKFLFIKAGVIPMQMVFRGKEEVPTETIQAPSEENWYQDLKDFPSIALPEKALVGASMSLNWRMNREDKPVYMEDGKGKNWGFSNPISYPLFSLLCMLLRLKVNVERCLLFPEKSDEELWYHRIAKNFVFPRDEDLSVQPSSGVGKYLFMLLYHSLRVGNVAVF